MPIARSPKWDVTEFTQDQFNRFWAKVDKTGTCWLWSGWVDPRGYGVLCMTTPLGKRKFGAHQIAYVDAIGPIPKGLEIDHLCRVRNCVNPAHLEAVTHAENLRRAGAAMTHCKRGHLFDEANTHIRKTGGRRCRKCNVIFERERVARNSASQL